MLQVKGLEDVPVVLHADVGGVQFSSWRRFMQGRRLESMVGVEADRDALNSGIERLGEDYDYLGLIEKGLMILTRGRWRPSKSPNRHVCSELVARVVPMFSDLDPERVSPQDLLRRLDPSDAQGS